MSNETARKHAESLAETYRKRTEAGSPFGHVNELDEWHDVDECDDHEVCNDASAIDYLGEVLDFDYIIGSDRTYKAARIMVGMGGPNVWLNTLTETVDVSWWSGVVSAPLPREMVDALDDAMAELYEMGN